MLFSYAVDLHSLFTFAIHVFIYIGCSCTVSREIFRNVSNVIVYIKKIKLKRKN